MKCNQLVRHDNRPHSILVLYVGHLYLGCPSSFYPSKYNFGRWFFFDVRLENPKPVLTAILSTVGVHISAKKMTGDEDFRFPSSSKSSIINAIGLNPNSAKSCTGIYPPPRTGPLGLHKPVRQSTLRRSLILRATVM